MLSGFFPGSCMARIFYPGHITLKVFFHYGLTQFFTESAGGRCALETSPANEDAHPEAAEMYLHHVRFFIGHVPVMIFSLRPGHDFGFLYQSSLVFLTKVQHQTFR